MMSTFLVEIRDQQFGLAVSFLVPISNHTDYLRLNHQHWLIKQHCGYLLHPSIPKTNPNFRVADVGTGTG